MAIISFNYLRYRRARNIKKLLLGEEIKFLVKPIYFTASWVSNYMYLTWLNLNGIKSQVEVYRSYDGNAFTLIDTTNENAEMHKYEPAGNIDTYFKIRAKKNNVYSEFSDVVLVAKSDDVELESELWPDNELYPDNELWVE